MATAEEKPKMKPNADQPMAPASKPEAKPGAKSDPKDDLKTLPLP